jgi:hypothetical protein
MSILIPTEVCYSPLHLYYCVVALIVVLLQFLNAYRWIASVLATAAERPKQVPVHLFTLSKTQSRYAALALLLKSLFVIPLVCLQQREHVSVSATLLFVFSAYYFACWVGWAPYISYKTNRWVAAVLAMVVWTNASGMALAWTGRYLDPSEASEAWYGSVVWLVGLPIACIAEYWAASWQQRRSLQKTLAAQVCSVFADAPATAPGGGFGSGDATVATAVRRAAHDLSPMLTPSDPRQRSAAGHAAGLHHATATHSQAQLVRHTLGGQVAYASLSVPVLLPPPRSWSDPEPLSLSEGSERSSVPVLSLFVSTLGDAPLSLEAGAPAFPPSAARRSRLGCLLGPFARCCTSERHKQGRQVQPMDSARSGGSSPSKGRDDDHYAGLTAADVRRLTVRRRGLYWMRVVCNRFMRRATNWSRALLFLPPLPGIKTGAPTKDATVLPARSLFPGGPGYRRSSAVVPYGLPILPTGPTCALDTVRSPFAPEVASSTAAYVVDWRECLIGLNKSLWQLTRSVVASLDSISAVLLSSNRLSPVALSGMFSFMAANPQFRGLHTLDLTNNPDAFGNASADETGHPEGRWVLLRRCIFQLCACTCLEPKGVQPIAVPLDSQSDCSSISSFTSLDPPFAMDDSEIVAMNVSVTKDTPTKDRQGIDGLVRLLGHCPTLRALVLDSCILTEQDVHSLVLALAASMHIPESDIKKLVGYVAQLSPETTGIALPHIARKPSGMLASSSRNSAGTMNGVGPPPISCVTAVYRQ